MGGLGVGSLLAKNLGLLAKWKWRFLTERNSLWRIVIENFYGGNGAFDSPSNLVGSNGVWCNIVKAVSFIDNLIPTFKHSFRLNVSNGQCTAFWSDPWCGVGLSLKDAFPRLFALESQQDCKVCDRWCQVDGGWGGNWSWGLPPRGRAINDLSNLISLIGHLSLSTGSMDKWSWMSDSSRLFKVKTLSNTIQSHLFPDYDL
ncbi:hypothetical protein Tco_1365921, partial [Tanacetum coccineum]